jgi:hypothetical protein
MEESSPMDGSVGRMATSGQSNGGLYLSYQPRLNSAAMSYAQHFESTKSGSISVEMLRTQGCTTQSLRCCEEDDKRGIQGRKEARVILSDTDPFGLDVNTLQPVNFTQTEALQFRDSIRVAAAVPKFPLRLK